MSIYVIGSSALHYWRRVYDGAQILSRGSSQPLIDCPLSTAELRSINIAPGHFGASPIHLMIPTEKQRFLNDEFCYTIESRDLPRSSFRKIDAGVYVASPEFCLMQAARVLSIARFLELCMELCGTYALRKDDSRGFVTRDFQLMTVNSFQGFLKSYNRTLLNRRVLPLLKYLVDGSHSPMETRQHLLISLPKRLGGYGLPPASLNMQIQLDENERQLSARSFFLCDMCWPERRIVVEYDGQEDHASAKDRASDATRRNVLISKGYTVFIITFKQMHSTREFDSVVREVARHLGFRLKSFPQDWPERRDELRRELFRSVAFPKETLREKDTVDLPQSNRHL